MEIREFDVITVGGPLSALLACLDKQQGMTVTAEQISPPSAIATSQTALLGRSLSVEALLQQLVQIGLGAVLVLVERVHEL